MTETLKRKIICRDCNKPFVYEYIPDTKSDSLAFGLRGRYTKKYCDTCKEMRKFVQSKESSRRYVSKLVKTALPTKTSNPTKKSVVHYAIKYVSELNKYSNTIEESTKTYDKIINILPDGYITRDTLRRHYREAKLHNEIQ